MMFDADYIEQLLSSSIEEDQKEFLEARGFDMDSIVLATRDRWLGDAIIVSKGRSDLLFCVGFINGMEAAIRAVERKELEDQFN